MRHGSHTAGMRDTSDPVEKLGVERSRRAMETADLILLVEDGAVEPDVIDEDIIDEMDLQEAVLRAGKPWIYIASTTAREKYFAETYIRFFVIALC